MSKDINLIFQQATEEIKERLKPIETVSIEEAGNIIGRYTAAVEGNFVPWMAAAMIYANSPEGKKTAQGNLRIEIVQNHPGMLRQFAEAAGAGPSLEHYHAVEFGV